MQPSLQSNCQNCSLTQFCLPTGLDKNELEQLDNMTKQRHPIQRGTFLCRTNEPMHALFAVRSGSMKTFYTETNGKHQINGFMLPGDIIGLESITKRCHGNNAVALETTSICEIPFISTERLSATFPTLQHQLFRVLSNAIATEQSHNRLRNKRAQQRIATFILQLSDKFERLSFSANNYKLSMTRSDIANYLGLAVETVSRIFTQLQKHDLITIENKQVTIHNHEKLHQLADSTTE